MPPSTLTVRSLRLQKSTTQVRHFLIKFLKEKNIYLTKTIHKFNIFTVTILLVKKLVADVIINDAI